MSSLHRNTHHANNEERLNELATAVRGGDVAEAERIPEQGTDIRQLAKPI